jgi:hypothetical protein
VREDQAATARIWTFIDSVTAVQSTTVAYAGNNIPYPLSGRRLDNPVFFIPRDGSSPTFGIGTGVGNPAAAGNRKAWRMSLEKRGVAYLCVFGDETAPDRPFPVEAAWAAEARDMFTSVLAMEWGRVYRILDSRDAPAPAEGAETTDPSQPGRR